MAKASVKTTYDNQSISSLKGPDRVRKRPGVIFGSDGLDGCQHAVFEILSNAIDEAREGHGSQIIVTRYQDHSIEVEDFGRGCPTTSTPWDSTAWAPAPPSTPPATLTPPSTGTALSTPSTLSGANWWGR